MRTFAARASYLTVIGAASDNLGEAVIRLQLVHSRLASPERPIWSPYFSTRRGPVLRALRLRANAPTGEVLVSTSAREVAPLEPIPLKGHCRPVPAFAVVCGSRETERRVTASHDARVRALGTRGVFASLSDRALAHLVARADEVSYASGEELMVQGTPGDFACLILSGSVAIDVTNELGRSTVATLGPGDLVGELAAFSETTRIATVTAIGPVRALRIERRVIRALLAANPDMALSVIGAHRRSVQPGQRGDRGDDPGRPRAGGRRARARDARRAPGEGRRDRHLRRGVPEHGARDQREAADRRGDGRRRRDPAGLPAAVAPGDALPGPVRGRHPDETRARGRGRLLRPLHHRRRAAGLRGRRRLGQGHPGGALHELLPRRAAHGRARGRRGGRGADAGQRDSGRRQRRVHVRDPRARDPRSRDRRPRLRQRRARGDVPPAGVGRGRGPRAAPAPPSASSKRRGSAAAAWRSLPATPWCSPRTG